MAARKKKQSVQSLETGDVPACWERVRQCLILSDVTFVGVPPRHHPLRHPGCRQDHTAEGLLHTRLCAKCLIDILHPNSYCIGAIIITTLQIWKLKFEKVKSSDQGHTAG